jgi:phage shock protein PspC (stress-responsive transcriptional regulator)
MNATAPSSTSSAANSATSPAAGPVAPPRPLCRPAHGRMLAGVASGLARYLHVDALLVRIAFVVGVFVGGVAIPAYLACWLLIRDEHAVESIAGEFASSVDAWRN